MPIPKSVRDGTIERWTERARRVSARGACGTPDPGFAVQHFQALRSSTPRFYPPVSVAVTGLDGSLLLLGRWTPAGQSWLQLGTDGQPVGRLILPDNEVLMQATLGQAWVRRTDDVGLQSVVRYKLGGIRVSCSMAPRPGTASNRATLRRTPRNAWRPASGQRSRRRAVAGERARARWCSRAYSRCVLLRR